MLDSFHILLLDISNSLIFQFAKADHGKYEFDWTATINYPIAFNQFYSALATNNQNSGNGCMVMVHNPTATSCVVGTYSKTNAAGTCRYIYLLVIGS